MPNFSLKPLILFILIFINNIFYAQTSDLSIEMLVDNKTPNVRSNIKFTITIFNSGPDDATGVSVINDLSNGYGEITDITDDGIKAGNTVYWSELKVPANSNIFLHFNVKVLSNGKYLNRAEIAASDNYDPNSDPESGFDINDLADRYTDDDEVEIIDITPIPSDFDKDTVFDKNDLDDDNDGIPDTYESNGVNPDADFDGDGTPVYLDDNDNNFDIGDNNNAVESFFDFDNDGIANHLDYDSDDDGIFDLYESGHNITDFDYDGAINGSLLDFGDNGLFDKLETSTNRGELIYFFLNTDNDDYLNFLDVDDDNDGLLTIDEEPDLDGDGDPEDARDSNNDGIPDYLDRNSTRVKNTSEEAAAIDQNTNQNKTVTISSNRQAINIKLFTDKGHEITPTINKLGNLVQLDISNLESGIYFLQFKSAGKINIKRMVID